MRKRLNLAPRTGAKPNTSRRLPHSQLDQHGPDHVIKKLHEWCFALAHVANEQSGISVPGARALVLHGEVACNHEAFMVGREFAHIHPHPDSGSMHVQLPREDALEVAEKGWGEEHYLVAQGRLPIGLVMVFSPRTDDELGVVKEIVERSYEYAIGAHEN
ncbi:MAG: hypothetical protein AAF658_12090 [Myxococcota bacterium]